MFEVDFDLIKFESEADSIDRALCNLVKKVHQENLEQFFLELEKSEITELEKSLLLLDLYEKFPFQVKQETTRVIQTFKDIDAKENLNEILYSK